MSGHWRPSSSRRRIPVEAARSQRACSNALRRQAPAGWGRGRQHDPGPPGVLAGAVARVHRDPGERLPGVAAWATLRGAVGPGSMGCPGEAQGRTRTPPIDIRRNANSGPGVTVHTDERLRPTRPRGPPSRGRVSRAASPRTFAGLRRYIDSKAPGRHLQLTGPQPQSRLPASGVVAGTKLWGSSLPGPIASPVGWTASPQTTPDHQVRHLPRRRHLETGGRPRPW
jgi:hypothetical protein